MAYTSPHTQALSEIADGIYKGTGKKDDPGVMKYHYVQIPRPKKKAWIGKGQGVLHQLRRGSAFRLPPCASQNEKAPYIRSLRKVHGFRLLQQG